MYIEQYDLVLLDFDGLLVNTELLHFQAYQKMCADRSFLLSWDFQKYCSIAHMSSDGLRQAIYEDFPDLHEKEPNWSVLYGEKKRAYEELLCGGQIELMPGVLELLSLLEEKKVARCVVTNSFKEQTDLVQDQIPILRTLPIWITRRDYKRPKPSPDPYLVALERMGVRPERAIGFEDTPRGLEALVAASIQGVLISSHLPQEERLLLQERGIQYYPSFKEVLGLSS